MESGKWPADRSLGEGWKVENKVNRVINPKTQNTNPKLKIPKPNETQNPKF